MHDTLSTPPDAGKECNEYAAMLRRVDKHGSQKYSVGHRRMYGSMVELLKGAPCSLLEVGFGIGYGAVLMAETLMISSYQGVEPHPDSFKHTSEQLDRVEWKFTRQTSLHNCYWSEAVVTPAEYAFCIEVIEHIPEAALSDFLWKLRRNTTKNLFLSTPDSTKSAHGVKSQAEWTEVLRRHGFSAVAVAHQWTTLFVCS